MIKSTLENSIYNNNNNLPAIVTNERFLNQDDSHINLRTIKIEENESLDSEETIDNVEKILPDDDDHDVETIIPDKNESSDNCIQRIIPDLNEKCDKFVETVNYIKESNNNSVETIIPDVEESNESFKTLTSDKVEINSDSKFNLNERDYSDHEHYDNSIVDPLSDSSTNEEMDMDVSYRKKVLPLSVCLVKVSYFYTYTSGCMHVLTIVPLF